jgi:hypothetical protein
MQMHWVRHAGGCHCGRVRFEVRAPSAPEVLDCNCSICSKTGFLHLIVSKESFKLVSGGEALTAYTFNTGAAKHLFCSVCGIKSFYVPRSHPDGYSVNVRCLDEPIPDMVVKRIDGRNWKAQFPEGRGTPPPG